MSEKKKNENKQPKNDDMVVDEDEEIVSLTYEDGTSENFYLLAELDYENKWYAYLEPVDPPEVFEDGNVLVYEEAEDEEGQEVLLPVEDEELLEKLVEHLNEELKKVD